VPSVPAKDVYVPATVVQPPIASNGDIAVCRVKETELFVKLPVGSNAQYSVVLFEAKVASITPPGSAVKASACAVTAPAPVVGLTNKKGR
jgi:hypothetical protein